MTWRVSRLRRSPLELHERPMPDPAERVVWVCEATGPALVLGSAQPADGLDRAACATAGIEVVRRRSGGGAVLVVPGDVLWLDLLLPAGDDRWQDDVGRAAHWVGEAWAGALASLGVRADVHRGALVRSAWSDEVCFAGLGPGEVTVDGRKVVGISQRRTRAAARFQCAALLRWDPALLVPLLGLPPSAAADLQSVAAGLTPDPAADVDSLLTALLAHLP